MRRLLALLGLVAAATASAASAGGGPSPGVTAGWDGIHHPTKPIRYVTMNTGTGTVVAAISTRTGRVERFGSVAGQLGIPLVAFDGTTAGLSDDARTLVLAQPLGGVAAPTSRFVFYDLKRFRVRDEVTLRGAFSFDALSPSGRTLYLIEHVALARDASRYRVRAYDLRTGRLLRAAIKDRRNSHTTMRGFPYARATSPDGVWVYTLYGGAEYAFVHALNTERRDAICIALPWPGTARALPQLRLSVRGARLVLSRRGSSAATIDLKRLRVLSAARLR